MGLVRSGWLETLVARNRKRHPRENCPQHTAAAAARVTPMNKASGANRVKDSIPSAFFFLCPICFLSPICSVYLFPAYLPIFWLCGQIDWLILSDDRTIPPLHQAVKLGGRNRTHGTGRHPALVHSTLGEVRLPVVRVCLRARDGAGLPCLTPGPAITR